jgi:hypothetical protein
MRFLTILISIFVGIMLCAIFLGNNHPVHVNLEPFLKRPTPYAPPYRVMSLWVVMISCVGIGALLGYLLGVSGSYNPAPAAAPKAVPPQKKHERDYLLIDAPADRRG